MTDYTIEELAGPYAIDDKLENFFDNSAQEISALYGNKFEYKNFDIFHYLLIGRIVVVRAGDEPIGVMLSRLFGSVFDRKRKILYQDLLFSKSPMATWMLMQDFIDFGKVHANHVITMIGAETNIKGSSLEKLGFKKLEEVYRLEV